VPFSWRIVSQRLPLIFKDFHMVAAAPGDMNCDMEVFFTTRSTGLAQTVRWSVEGDQLKLQYRAAVNTKSERGDEWMWNRNDDL
jgi:hypothetical protein